MARDAADPAPARRCASPQPGLLKANHGLRGLVPRPALRAASDPLQRGRDTCAARRRLQVLPLPVHLLPALHPQPPRPIDQAEEVLDDPLGLGEPTSLADGADQGLGGGDGGLKAAHCFL